MNQVTQQATVVTQTSPRSNQLLSKVALFDTDGNPITELGTATGDQILMTGYDAQDPDDVEATDTLNEAMGKVEARVATLETAQASDIDTAAEVRAVVLTGLSTATITAVTAADSLLVAIGKLQGHIADLETRVAALEA